MWDAGAITGKLGLNISEYAHGMLEAEGIMQVFPSIVTEFLENPILGFISLAKEAGEAAIEMGKKLVEMLGEVASHAQQEGLAALKSGVSVEFFSDLVEAGKRVGVTADEIGNSFKFMERNAVAALEGNQEAARGFQMLGISADFLQDHLNDSQAMFKAVQEGLGQIPNVSERTRAALSVLGREGAGMIPLFLMSKQAMQDHLDTAHELGAGEDAESVKAAQGWFKLTAAIDDMWEGLKKAFADAFLKQIDDNWGTIKQTIIDLSHVLRDTIPAATFAAVSAMELLLKAIENAVTGLAGFALITDKLTITHGMADDLAKLVLDLKQIEKPLDKVIELADKARSAPPSRKEEGPPGSWVDNLHFDAQFNFNGDESTSQIVAKLTPVVQDAMRKNEAHQQKMLDMEKVSRSLGGHGRGFYVPGQ